MKIKAIEIRKGNVLLYNNELCKVTDSMHVTPGKGAALMQVKMKRLKDASNVEERFRPGESVEKAIITTQEMQYLYNDGTNYYFMNNETYEQIGISADFLGDQKAFLVDEMIIMVEVYEGTPIGIELPSSVELKIVDTEPIMRGATVSSSYKPAKLENGVDVQVPPFVEVGDRIKIDTRDIKYIERVK
ncbi:MAG: elongation factor P [Calditrichia bacterium]|nr:elongation factor P [Calditrichia bacterium]